MNKKLTSIFAVIFVAAGLAACGRAVADQPGAPAGPETGGGNHEEARTGATVTNDAAMFRENFLGTGHWIGAATDNIVLEEDLLVEGDFWEKDEEANDHRRKIALYTQDADRNVLDRFSVTAPRVIVRSPNTVVAKGTIVGDIYVEANGFSLDDATVEGNIIFASQEYHDSANLADGHVRGDVTVQ